MAHAYTPGLKVARQTTHTARRILPLPGKVVVRAGQQVAAQDVVAEAFMPGDITPVNLANLLSLPPGDVAECLLKSEGERTVVGEVIARTKGIFGMFKSEYKSKVAGTLESISSVTGQMIIRGEPLPVRVLAYLAGKIDEVIPDEGVVIKADVALVQGIFGIGGETFGRIQMAGDEAAKTLTADLITAEMQGGVIVGHGRVTDEALEKAVKIGAAAIVCAGIDDHDLKEFLGVDLGVAITGSENVGITLVITEGFGDIVMAQRTWALLASHAGQQASVNGATQIRAGVMRPEVLIPLEGDAQVQHSGAQPQAGYLELDRTVRMIRDPYFGRIGRVSGLPPEPQVLASGSKARVLEVKFDSGESVIVPRANVELIEE